MKIVRINIMLMVRTNMLHDLIHKSKIIILVTLGIDTV